MLLYYIYHMLQVTNKLVVFKPNQTAKNSNAGIILYTLARFNCDSVSPIRHLHSVFICFHVDLSVLYLICNCK